MKIFVRFFSPSLSPIFISNVIWNIWFSHFKNEKRFNSYVDAEMEGDDCWDDGEPGENIRLSFAYIKGIS